MVASRLSEITRSRGSNGKIHGLPGAVSKSLFVTFLAHSNVNPLDCRVIAGSFYDFREKAKPRRKFPPIRVESWLVIKPASGDLKHVVPRSRTVANSQDCDHDPTRWRKQVG